mgnify:CR=1 FL=1
MPIEQTDPPGGVCPPCAAGLFYPASAPRLQSVLHEVLDNRPPRPAGAGAATALIVPHAALTYSGRVAGRAYACVDGTAVERVVVLAPAHRAAFRGLSVGLFRAFRTPLGDMPVDTGVCQDLAHGRRGLAAHCDVFRGEHAIEVQLPFLQTICPAARLVPVLCGDIRAEDVAPLSEALATAVPRAGTLWVVSSDFTHYGPDFGYMPFTSDVLNRIEQLDRGAIDAILRRDAAGWREYIHATGATICGADAIGLLLALVPRLGPDWQPHLLDYAQSGRLAHDETHSVGYAAIAFFAAAVAGACTWRPAAASGKVLLGLARDALGAEVHGRPFAAPAAEGLPPDLRAPGASFVTLHCHGALRGCMGSLEGRRPLYLDVIDNALNAGFRDPRFEPVSPAEWPAVEIEVSVLSPLQSLAEPRRIELGLHGILLRRGHHGAVYLPQVAVEQGWDLETTLEHLSAKAGLPAGAWRQGAEFQVFECALFAEGKA